MKNLRTIALVLAAMILTSLAPSGQAEASGKKHQMLSIGDWGGEHVSMKVTASGADLDFDCASGKIASPIVIDGNGTFEVSGTYHAEHGGPVRRDEESSATNARFVGRTSERILTLTITLLESNEAMGSFRLEKGSLGHVMKCR